MSVQFEWNKDKAASNLDKHGVSFDEASTVFLTPWRGFLATKITPKVNDVKLLLGTLFFAGCCWSVLLKGL